MDAGILAVKSLERAKARLASDYGDQHRVEIATALYKDALDLCRDTEFLRWWVVSDDPTVIAEAGGLGFDTIRDGGAGLNEALLPALTSVADAGARSAIVIPSDTPLAEPSDIEDLLDTGGTSDVVVVPSARDGGTNGLYLRPPTILQPSFGIGSLRKHIDEAESKGLRCTILVLERLGVDLDTAADMQALLERGGEGRTMNLLRHLRSEVRD